MNEFSTITRNNKRQKQASQKKSGESANTQPRKKTPRKITATYLHNSGLYYLERFATSSTNFKTVMLRKVKRSCMAHPDQNYEACAALVDDLVQKFVRVGLLDDTLYTRSAVTSMRRRGKSARAIHAYLQSKGLDNTMIADHLRALDEDTCESTKEAEYKAALIFARKKRIGPFEKDKGTDPQKALGRLARAGFSYDTSRNVLETEFEKADELIRTIR